MSTLFMKNQVSARASVINDSAEDFLDIKTTDVRDKETAALTFYDNGMIRTCNKEVANLLNCSPNELIGQHITNLLPQLKEIKLIEDNKINAYLHFLSRIGHRFKVVSMNGSHFMSKLFFIDMEYLGRHYLRVILRPVQSSPVQSSNRT